MACTEIHKWGVKLLGGVRRRYAFPILRGIFDNSAPICFIQNIFTVLSIFLQFPFLERTSCWKEQSNETKLFSSLLTNTSKAYLINKVPVFNFLPAPTFLSPTPRATAPTPTPIQTGNMHELETLASTGCHGKPQYNKVY